MRPATFSDSTAGTMRVTSARELLHQLLQQTSDRRLFDYTLRTIRHRMLKAGRRADADALCAAAREVSQLLVDGGKQRRQGSTRAVVTPTVMCRPAVGT